MVRGKKETKITISGIAVGIHPMVSDDSKTPFLSIKTTQISSDLQSQKWKLRLEIFIVPFSERWTIFQVSSVLFCLISNNVIYQVVATVK